jgi:hypothetical protein
MRRFNAAGDEYGRTETEDSLPTGFEESKIGKRKRRSPTERMDKESKK